MTTTRPNEGDAARPDGGPDRGEDPGWTDCRKWMDRAGGLTDEQLDAAAWTIAGQLEPIYRLFNWHWGANEERRPERRSSCGTPDRREIARVLRRHLDEVLGDDSDVDSISSGGLWVDATDPTNPLEVVSVGFSTGLEWSIRFDGEVEST